MKETRMAQGLRVLKIFFIAALSVAAPAGAASARDVGQWENGNPAVKEWYQSLRRPDYPDGACCGEADAYWADEYYYRDGKAYARITDERPDGPLRRPHVPNGTEIQIPEIKLKWDQSNPTGHNVLFLGVDRQVLCFVQGTGS